MLIKFPPLDALPNDIWRTARELVRWRGTDANAWAFWLEVERAVKELLAPPDATQH
jgi:hypothetical protein